MRNALEHARYEAGVDRLVFAGDFADRGPDGRACLELIEASGAGVLWGESSGRCGCGCPRVLLSVNPWW